MTLPLLALAAALLAPPPEGLTTHKAPTWAVLATAYQPNQRDNRPHHDSSKGGGANAGWTGQHLEPWHCAVGGSYVRGKWVCGPIALGTKLWIGSPVNRLVVGVDTGGQVHGLHLDICEPNPKKYLALGRALDRWKGRVNVWRIGKLSKEQARRWRGDPSSQSR